MKTTRKKKPTIQGKKADSQPRGLGIMASSRMERGEPMAEDGKVWAEAHLASEAERRAEFIESISMLTSNAAKWLEAKGYTGGRIVSMLSESPPKPEDRRAAEAQAFLMHSLGLADALRRHHEAGEVNAFHCIESAFWAGVTFWGFNAIGIASPSPGRGQWSSDLDAFNDHLAERVTRGDRLPGSAQLPTAFNKFQIERSRPPVDLADKVAYGRFRKALLDAKRRPRNTTLASYKRG
jgi:hypothetical protein